MRKANSEGTETTHLQNPIGYLQQELAKSHPGDTVAKNEL